MLRTQLNNNTNNKNKNNNNINNQNKGGEPIRVPRGGNNWIIDSTILFPNSLLFDADDMTKLQTKDKSVANSISKIKMETENPNEIVEVNPSTVTVNTIEKDQLSKIDQQNPKWRFREWPKT